MKSTSKQFTSTIRDACNTHRLCRCAGGTRRTNQAWAQYDPGQANLAIGGTATATNTDFGGTPDKGIDGNRDGNFGDGSVYYGNSPNSEGTDSNPSTTYFYQVDLGQNDYINRVQFLPRTDAVQNVFGNFNISIYQGVPDPSNPVEYRRTPTFSQNYNTSYFGAAFATAAPGINRRRHPWPVCEDHATR